MSLDIRECVALIFYVLFVVKYCSEPIVPAFFL